MIYFLLSFFVLAFGRLIYIDYKNVKKINEWKEIKKSKTIKQ